MEIRTPFKARERILLYGGPGVGKSRAVLSTARSIPSARFYVVDNDLSYGRLLETEFSDVQNVIVFDVDSDDWEEQLAAAQKASDQCQPDDWFVFDMLTETWQAVQSWFTEKVFGVDHADYFMQLRIQKEAQKEKDRRPVHMMNDDRWIVINRQYKKLQRTVLTCSGHVICTSEAASIDSNFDDKETKSEFGEYGLKPKGQKRWAHIFSTVLLLKKSRSGVWSMTTVKDRGRTEMLDKPINDFAKDYLMLVAGWRPTSKRQREE